MPKYTYKLSDMLLQFERSEGVMEEVEGLTKFSLPGLEAGTEELSGYSGLMGTLELVDWASVGALEMTLTFADVPENGEIVISPEKRNIKLSWAEKFATKAGDVGWNNYIVYATGFLKTFPGGDGEKGSKYERELAYSLMKYKYSKNGQVVIEYDPANDIISFYGVNHAEKIKKAVLGDVAPDDVNGNSVIVVPGG